ncbi:MAG TPA: hypothetical protein VK966_02150 [Longimicrobiales bacterium]|nr:hypothetical protein [Longimicrobiales bacterium]
MSERTRWRWIVDPAEPDARPERVKVVEECGVEGFLVRGVDSCFGCFGCFESGEYMGMANNYPWDEKAGCHVGAGCDECGYTGKRRWTWFVPFDHVKVVPNPRRTKPTTEDT